MKHVVVSFLMMGLMGCSPTVPPVADATLAWYELPNDPEVYQYTFDRCLMRARGLLKTHYNDADEVVEACGRMAGNLSRYCPPGGNCTVGTSSRQDVRGVLHNLPYQQDVTKDSRYESSSSR